MVGRRVGGGKERGGGRGKVRLADNHISAEAVHPLVQVQIGCNCYSKRKALSGSIAYKRIICHYVHVYS